MLVYFFSEYQYKCKCMYIYNIYSSYIKKSKGRLNKILYSPCFKKQTDILEVYSFALEVYHWLLTGIELHGLNFTFNY